MSTEAMIEFTKITRKKSSRLLPTKFDILLVRTPEEFERRLQMRDWFMRDIAREGVTLYAA
jgi:hypothetical protein